MDLVSNGTRCVPVETLSTTSSLLMQKSEVQFLEPQTRFPGRSASSNFGQCDWNCQEFGLLSSNRNNGTLYLNSGFTASKAVLADMSL